MTKWKKTIVLSDIHCPSQDKKLIKKIQKFIGDYSPNELIFNGDILDIYSLAKYNEDNFGKFLITLEQEYEYGNELLDSFESVLSKNAKKHYLVGNHEQRVKKFLNKGDNIKFGEEILSLERGLNLKSRKYKYYDDYENDFVGINDNLIVFHDAGLNIHPGYTYLRKSNHNSIIYGHAHRSSVTNVGDRIAIGSGHLADLTSPFMSYATRLQKEQWSQGFVIINSKDSSWFYENVVVNNGSFMVQGQIY